MKTYKVSADKTFLEGDLKGITVDWYVSVNGINAAMALCDELQLRSDSGILSEVRTNNRFELSNFNIEVTNE